MNIKIINRLLFSSIFYSLFGVIFQHTNPNASRPLSAPHAPVVYVETTTHSFQTNYYHPLFVNRKSKYTSRVLNPFTTLTRVTRDLLMTTSAYIRDEKTWNPIWLSATINKFVKSGLNGIRTLIAFSVSCFYHSLWFSRVRTSSAYFSIRYISFWLVFRRDVYISPDENRDFSKYNGSPQLFHFPRNTVKK